MKDARDLTDDDYERILGARLSLLPPRIIFVSTPTTCGPRVRLLVADDLDAKPPSSPPAAP